MPNPKPNTKGLKPPFSKGESGNPEGRPPSRVPDALIKILGTRRAKKFHQLNGVEINEWETTVLTMTGSELKALAGWDEANSYAKGLAMGILFDMKNGNTKTIDKLRERQFGKAIQKVELTGRDGKPLNPEPIMIEIIDNRNKVDSDNENSDNENI
jgi:hypothetical protein